VDKTVSVPFKCEFCQSNDIKVIDVNAECGQYGKLNDLNAIRNITKQKGYEIVKEHGRQIINDELKKIQSTNCTMFLMITSAKNSDFENDYKIQDYSNTNLQGECIVRFKIFTLDNSILKNKIGELNDIDKKEVIKILENSLCKN
jgi:hypothetical protein